jgi:hypothetical protein
MAILKTEPDRKDILVGAYVSRRIHSYFTLFTLAKGVSKSKIFTELFYDWISKQKEIDSEAELLRQIIMRVQKTRKRVRNRDMDIGTFKKVIGAELLSKGVAENYVALILSEIN